MRTNIYLNELQYHNIRLVKLFFYACEIIEKRLKELDYVRFSHQFECYYMRWQNDNFSRLQKDMKDIANISDRYLHYKTCINNEMGNISEEKKEFVNEALTRSDVSAYLTVSKIYVKLPVPSLKIWCQFMIECDGIYEEKRRFWILPKKIRTLTTIREYFKRQGCQFFINQDGANEMVMNSKKANYWKDDEINTFIKAMTLQGASQRTIDNYACQIKKLKNHYEGKQVVEISDDEIREYMYFLREKLMYSCSAQNIVVSSIKRFFLSVTDREFNPNHIPRPVKRKTLPKTLDRESVTKLLKLNLFIKHKCILYLLYATGMRCGELINLKVEDISLDNSLIVVKNGKGGKDRIVFLPDQLKDLLVEYFRRKKPHIYVLEGQNGGKYSASSVQRVVGKASRMAGIDKHVTPHMLRHSFATHLHDSGIDIRNIQVLLGHSSTKTTEIYTYISKRDISKLKSPLEYLDI